MQITVHTDWETTQKSLFQCIHILFDSVSIYWYVLLMFKVVKLCFEILYWIACIRMLYELFLSESDFKMDDCRDVRYQHNDTECVIYDNIIWLLYYSP